MIIPLAFSEKPGVGMKFGFVLFALFVAPTAFAFPKQGSKAVYKVTSAPIASGSSTPGEATKTDAITPLNHEMTMQVTELNSEKKLMKIKTSFSIDSPDNSFVSDPEPTAMIDELYKMKSKCTKAAIKKLGASTPSTEDDSTVSAVSAETIDTIFGKSKACKIISVKPNGKQITHWVSDQAFGFLKIEDSEFGMTMNLASYTE